MQNFFGIETEAAFRRSECERAVVAAGLAAQAHPRNEWAHWAQPPQRILARLRSISAPRVATLVVDHRRGVGKCAQSLQGGCATAA